MHCPYCGGINRDQTVFCVNCGRDMRGPANAPRVAATAPPSYTVAPPAGVAARSRTAPTSTSTSRSGQVPPPPPVPYPPARSSQSSVATPVAYQEPPVPFPPRNMAGFTALLAGAQAYEVLSSTIGDGMKKTVLIAYPQCAGWQQAATLLKALQDHKEEKCGMVVIQGIITRQQDTYGFTNGQLQYNRRVNLGASLIDRYIVDTGNGCASDTVRFVLSQ